MQHGAPVQLQDAVLCLPKVTAHTCICASKQGAAAAEKEEKFGVHDSYESRESSSTWTFSGEHGHVTQDCMLKYVCLRFLGCCIQVYMSSVPLADFAANIAAEEQALDPTSSSDEEGLDDLSSSSDEEDLNQGTDSDAVSAPAASSASLLEAGDAINGKLQERQEVQSSGNATEEQQPLNMTNASDGIPHGDVTDGERLTSDAADIAPLDGADVLGATTLVVRKGQQLQELVVSGSITQGKLRDETEKIVSFLLSLEDSM